MDIFTGRGDGGGATSYSASQLTAASMALSHVCSGPSSDTHWRKLCRSLFPSKKGVDSPWVAAFMATEISCAIDVTSRGVWSIGASTEVPA